MFRYIKSVLGIKERTDIENALIGVHQVESMAGDALVDLGEVSAGNMDAVCEIAELSAGNMDAIVELAGMVADLQAQVAALTANNS